VESANIGPFDSLILATPAETGSGPAISDGEAELLGWIMGDGYIARYGVRVNGSSALGDEILRIAAENPQASHREIGRMAGCTHQTVGAYLRANNKSASAHERTGTDSMFRISLYQAKPEGVAAIDALLAREGILFSRHEYAPKGVARLPKVEWHLRSSYSGELIKRSGFAKDGPVPFALSLSPSQRQAFMRGVFGAEGHQEPARMAFGRGPYPGSKIYSQADGPQQDAVTLGIYLTGHRPAINPWSVASRARFSSSDGANIRECMPRIGRAITNVAAGHAPVFCVTTDLGSWTARQGRQVWLTGDSR
jgi:hypothetical protein